MTQNNQSFHQSWFQQLPKHGTTAQITESNTGFIAKHDSAQKIKVGFFAGFEYAIQPDGSSLA